MSIDLKYGCIADDFTGASDAASFLKASGLKTVLCTGIPENVRCLDGCDAAVIALKTRSAAPDEAVRQSLDAIRFLRQCGARKLYFKYCSTFDSTPRGNIGPVLDSLLELLDQRYTLICPSLPVNGRTVKDGRLFVNGIPLDETHMRHHPLNPMWSSDIAVLMKDQSRYPCFTLTIQDIKEALSGNNVNITAESVPDQRLQRSLPGYTEPVSPCRFHQEAYKKARTRIEKRLGEMAGSAKHYYIVPDYYEDRHGALLWSLFGDLKLLSGGSGILGEIGGSLSGPEKNVAWTENERQTQLIGDTARAYSTDGTMCVQPERKTIILAGSCSKMTLDQIAFYQESGPSVKIDPAKVLDGSENADTVWLRAGGRSGILIYSSEPADKTRRIPQNLHARLSRSLEQMMAELAVKAVRDGYTDILVAGGETSGAVIQGLGYDSFLIGEQMAPGVPALIPSENKKLRLILKSGNFGDREFFTRVTGG